MVYFTFPINLLRHLKSLSAFRHKVHDNLTFCDHFVVTLRSKISISGIRRYKQIGFQKDRLPYPDYISAACCKNVLEVLNKSFSILCHELSKYEWDGTDYLLKIKMSNTGLLKSKNIKLLYEAGYNQTKKEIQKIRRNLYN